MKACFYFQAPPPPALFRLRCPTANRFLFLSLSSRTLSPPLFSPGSAPRSRGMALTLRIRGPGGQATLAGASERKGIEKRELMVFDLQSRETAVFFFDPDLPSSSSSSLSSHLKLSAKNSRRTTTTTTKNSPGPVDAPRRIPLSGRLGDRDLRWSFPRRAPLGLPSGAAGRLPRRGGEAGEDARLARPLLRRRARGEAGTPLGRRRRCRARRLRSRRGCRGCCEGSRSCRSRCEEQQRRSAAAVVVVLRPQ